MKAWTTLAFALAALPALAADPQNQPPGGVDSGALSRQEGQASGGLGGQGAGQGSWTPDQGKLGTSTLSDPQQAKQQTGAAGQATQMGQGKDCPPEALEPGCQQAAKPVEADQLRRENVPPSQFEKGERK